MASRSDRTRSHGYDGKSRKNSNPAVGCEFIQRYSKDEYSRAIPTSIMPKAKPRLGEYCVPVDSKPVLKQQSLDRIDLDPDPGYALPQDSLIGSTISSISQTEDDDGLVYELAQQPLQEYQSPPSSSSSLSKPSPMPRASLRDSDTSPQHNPNSKLMTVSSTHPNNGPEDDRGGGGSLSEYNLASACFAGGSPEVATSERKRPLKKVVEIEYEAISDLRPYRPSNAGSGQPVQRKSSLETSDPSVNISANAAAKSFKTESPQTNRPFGGGMAVHAAATPSPVYNVHQETLYEEPWDLKAKRLKDEQEKKEKERKQMNLIRADSKSTPPVVAVPDMRSDIYEEAWDTAAQQRKLEQKFKLSRTVSQTSEAGDVYHDSFESLPEPKVEFMKKDGSQMQAESKRDDHRQKPSPSKHDSPMRQQSNARADAHHKYPPQSKSDKPPQLPETPAPLQPLPCDTYEDAWDLKNFVLEEKIRQMQMQSSVTYEEPWESSKQQKELQAQFNRKPPAAFTDKLPTSVPRSSSDAREREHSAQAVNAARAYTRGRHHSIDEGRQKQKSRGPNIGQRINPMIPLSHQNWFHGNISRDDAEQMLCVCKEGSYIVRISSDRKSYSLSIKSSKQYIHVQIEQVVHTDSTLRYILGKNSKEFCTIPEMIDHYTHHRVPLKGAEHITLLHPVEVKWSQQS